MPPAKPSSIHMRASGAGLLARRKLVLPDWYMAMLSGISLFQPSSPWTSLPVSPFSWNPPESLRRWLSSRMISARSQIALKSRNSRLWELTEPPFIPTHRQSGPPAALVTRLFRSQISTRRA